MCKKHSNNIEPIVIKYWNGDKLVRKEFKDSTDMIIFFERKGIDEWYDEYNTYHLCA